MLNLFYCMNGFITLIKTPRDFINKDFKKHYLTVTAFVKTHSNVPYSEHIPFQNIFFVNVYE